MSMLLDGHMSAAMNSGFSSQAALLFDVHDEPVHCPAERCKLHWQCFGWLAVTLSVNEILCKFIITFHTYSYSFKVRGTKLQVFVAHLFRTLHAIFY